MKILPQARNTELVVQDLRKELLIYDLKTNQAMTLNETSRIVFSACDGTTPFDALKEKHQFTDEIIYLALDGLKKRDLLQVEYDSPFIHLSRREVIKKAGLASMAALPVITAIVAPTAAHAASTTCIPNGGSRVFPNQTCGPGSRGCTAFCNSQCCSGLLLSVGRTTGTPATVTCGC